MWSNRSQALSKWWLRYLSAHVAIAGPAGVGRKPSATIRRTDGPPAARLSSGEQDGLRRVMIAALIAIERADGSPELALRHNQSLIE